LKRQILLAKTRLSEMEFVLIWL